MKCLAILLLIALAQASRLSLKSTSVFVQADEDVNKEYSEAELGKELSPETDIDDVDDVDEEVDTSAVDADSVDGDLDIASFLQQLEYFI